MGSRYTSVEPHQTATRRSQPFSSLNRWMSVDERLGLVPLGRVGLDVVAVQVLDELLLEHGGHGLDGPQLVAELLEHVLVEDAGAGGGDVGVVGEDVPAAEHEVVEAGERDVVLDQRDVVVGALARAGSCPSGSASRSAWPGPCGWRGTPAMKVVPTAPMPGQQDAELALGGGDVDGGFECHVGLRVRGSDGPQRRTIRRARPDRHVRRQAPTRPSTGRDVRPRRSP